MQLTDWLLVEVALLLTGLTKIYVISNDFDRFSAVSRIQLRIAPDLLRIQFRLWTKEP
jgi:hypothetical protein